MIFKFGSIRHPHKRFRPPILSNPVPFLPHH